MSALLRSRAFLLGNIRWKSTSKKSINPLSPMRNPVSVIYGEEHAILDAKKGIVADNKPFKFRVEKYVEYTWCGCGLAHEQPFCDLTCQSKYWKRIYKEQGGPLTYIAPESGDVWFCNCKQTNKAPFCDGSHRKSEIQEMRIDGKFELFEPKS
uniref:CDGSH iron sulfur domain-containing protein 3, mitochondrial n=1 Tax=Lepeophtheirus salmonis TaxID=72036 RepID=D3PGU8_LEPSM|nr:CDGSH iron sulfur domain-containing protein 3, mitochondrial [Lepeophtheirus salmonis]